MVKRLFSESEMMKMGRKYILFLHGFASSRHSAKASYFRKKIRLLRRYRFHAFDFNPTPLDFKYLTITGMIERLRQHILERRIHRLRIIGSSLGALVALHFAHRYGMVEKMLLLAPALCYEPRGLTETQQEEWKRRGEGEVFHYHFNQKIPVWYDFHLDGLRYSSFIHPPIPITIIHGMRDDIVPVEESRDYANRYPSLVTLVEVDSDHLLYDHLELIWQRVKTDLLL